jgi:penicillin-binding protein 1A
MAGTKSSASKKNIGQLVVYVGVTCVILFLLLWALIMLGVFGKVPGKEELRQVRNYTASEIFTTDNVLLGRYYVENRTNTSLEAVPDFLINALIATEDARFYSHGGIDTRSTFRVIVKSLLLFNKESGGGSTLTQQLAKNLYPRRSVGFLTLPVAKIREIIIARRLEEVYTKSEILQLYLNTVPFGDNTYGIETASLVFFNRKTHDLLPQESATLIGMLKGNTDYNPARNYDAALKRRNLVFSQMVKYNLLTSNKAEKLKKLPIVLNYHKLRHDEGPAPYFREYLRQMLLSWSKANPKNDGSTYNIYTDGLKIYVTIDYRMQVAAENAVKKHLSKVQKEFDAQWKGKEPWLKHPLLAENEIKQSTRYRSLVNEGLSRDEILKTLKKPVDTKIFTWEGEKNIHISPLDSILHHFGMLQTGMISIESRTGFVKAWVGGIDYRYFKYDHVMAHRQAGSTFKPVVYAAALEKGIKPCDYFKNDSVVYTAYNNWTPKNATSGYGGFYSLQGAITHSINTVSTKVLMDVGINHVVDLAEKMGFEGDLPEVPSLALGSGTASVYELVQAYSVFLNHGTKVNPIMIRRIEDQAGNVLFTAGPEISNDSIISASSAETMLAMLCSVVNRGTAESLRSNYGFTSEMAGKTGTTQDHSDGWYVGLTPDLITAIWVGGDNPVVHFPTLTYGQGAYMALPIFARYMQQLYADPVYKSLQSSSFNISGETLDKLTCIDYREEEYNSIIDYLDKSEQTIVDFIRNIFRKKKNAADNKVEKDN